MFDKLPVDQRAVMEAFLAGKTFAEFAAELQARAPEAAGMEDAQKADDLVNRAATARKNFQYARAKLRPKVTEYERPRLSDDPTGKGKETGD